MQLIDRPYYGFISQSNDLLQQQKKEKNSAERYRLGFWPVTCKRLPPPDLKDYNRLTFVKLRSRNDKQDKKINRKQ